MFRLLRRIARIQALLPAAAACLVLAGVVSRVATTQPQASGILGVTPSVPATITAAVRAAVPGAPNVLDEASAEPRGAERSAPAQAGQREVPYVPPAQATIQLGPADNGTTRMVAAGTTILVQLPGVARNRWTVPSSSNSAVVQRLGGATGEDGSSQATFVAVAPGQALLTAIDNPFCFPVCALPPAGGWRVTIVVK